MKTRLITTLGLLMLGPALGLTAHADESLLAWQEPGYVEEIVIVTASRPTAIATPVVYAALNADSEVTLAWQEPGYVGEVVIVSASRSEVLARAREALREAGIVRDAPPRSNGSVASRLIR